MALNSAPILIPNGTILVEDGGALAATMIYEDGDFNIAGLAEGDYDVEGFKDRGDFYAFRQTDQKTYSLSFSCHATEISDGTETQALMDVMLKENAWSGGTSVITTGSDVWAVKVTYTADTSGVTGGEAGQTIVVNAFIPQDVSFTEGNPAKFSVSGICVPFGGTKAVTRT
jgi:hypothetical protein